MSRVGVVGVTLLLVALILAIVQLVTYQSALRNSGEFIGPFPANMLAINRLLKKTQYKLYIVNDFCDYGRYSRNDDYSQYIGTIISLKKNNGMRVEMHVYNSDIGPKMMASQLGLQDPKTAGGVFTTIEASALFKQYLDNRRKAGQSTIFASYTDFLASLESDEADCVKQLQAAQVDIHADVAAPLPLFTWIRDDSEAIFSIYNLGHDSREVSQRTENQQIVLLLQDIGNRLALGQ